VKEDELLDTMRTKGALLTGHFLLSSGRHSDTFVQKFRLLEDPEATRHAGEMLAEKFPEGFDVVAAPAIGAVILGFVTALAANARSIFSERIGGHMTFRRGFGLSRGERVLVVEDVITTGGSAREVVDLVMAAGGNAVGVGALIDRNDPAKGPLGAPLRALISLDVRSWDARDCPLCEQGVPLTDPGSRRLQA
jgi:orotate phosphoribosyltransferase